VPLSFHRLAERELNDAALYYERESRGLGIKFLNEIERYIEAILKNPNAGTSIRGYGVGSSASFHTQFSTP
jgi:toxin ParE1/3/4